MSLPAAILLVSAFGTTAIGLGVYLGWVRWGRRGAKH